MVEKYQLKADKREILGKKVKHLRHNGLIPAVVYGKKVAPVHISVGIKDLLKTIEVAGTSSLISLEIPDGKHNVLVDAVQYDPRSSAPIHVDFREVIMTEKLQTEIPLTFIGEAAAVEQLQGTLITPVDAVEVECLPGDLVHAIEVDTSVLNTFEDQIKVSDLKVPAGIIILTDPDEVIAMVEEPRSEEELAELETPTAEEEAAAVEELTKTEGEEGEEGKEGEDDAKSKDEPASEDKKDNKKED